MNKKQSRTGIIIIIAMLLAMVFTYAFWPKPIIVDMDKVTLSPMKVTIDEQAKTRVANAYIVSAPISGRILRVNAEPGDTVKQNESIIFRMLPLNSAVLDSRSQEQAKASISIAEAAIRVARADLNKAIADQNIAQLDLKRIKKLRETGTVAQSSLDRAEQVSITANASYETAKAAIAMREAELNNARALLTNFNEVTTDASESDNTLSISAPISGLVLQVMQKSEASVNAGTPILTIGDTSNDLEVIVELLSTDAVQVKPGNSVIIEKWGNVQSLQGIVDRIEPLAFTKFSALGVEEQRVNAIIKFTEPIEKHANLGDGYRVETRIVIWQSDNVLTVPSSALFRENGQWAVFVVHNNKAQLTSVEIGHSNGVQAEVLQGVNEDDQIILYPGPSVLDGVTVEQRVLE